MDPTIKKQWLKALRSGQYEQGRMALRTEAGTYCCLGVLVDITQLQPLTGTGGCLLDSTRQAVDLDIEDESIFVDANDDEGWTFEEIADYIEVML